MQVGVKISPSIPMQIYDAGDLDIKIGQNLICSTPNGICFGKAQTALQNTSNDFVGTVLRIATKHDIAEQAKIEQMQKGVLKESKNLVKQYGLEMKLVDARYTFDMSKLTISFTANGRIDFRQLVKSMACKFKTRIELRQIGVRDETKLVGGYGPCGRQLCCAGHLNDFGKVGLKMAKDQNLSLNPSGLTGICGRLMCCLQYEDKFYVDALQKMPKLGSVVKTADGEGIDIYNNILKNEVTVKFQNQDGSYTNKDYALSEVTFEKKFDGNKNEKN